MKNLYILKMKMFWQPLLFQILKYFGRIFYIFIILFVSAPI